MSCRRKASSCSSLVTMMKAAKLRNLHHRTQLWCLNRPWFRSILGQGQMSSGMQVILGIGLQKAAEGRFVKHHDVVEALAAYRADEAFCIGIGLGRQLHRMETVTHDVFE